MFTLHTLISLALVSTWLFVHAQEPAHADQSGESIDAENDGGEFENNHLEIFKKLFINKRKEHLSAVKDLRNLDTYQRKYEIIEIMIKNIVEVVKSKAITLEEIKEELIRNQTIFHVDHTLRDALSSVLENTALFGDIVLQLPHITHRILKKKNDWKSQMQWSLNFVNETRFFLDEATQKMIDLVFQELNIIARQPNYFNPWSSENQEGISGEEKEKRKKTRRKSEKGPRMVRVDL